MPVIQALDRALSILELFDEGTAELKITEISARTGLHKSTAHSLLKTMQRRGYIEQDAESGKYRLGLSLLDKGNLVLQRLDIRTAAKPHLAALSADTGQTTHLVVFDGAEGIYIDKVDGEKAAIRYSRIGRRVPLHSSAAGKALLAFLPRAEADALIASYRLFEQTPRTITDAALLAEELERVRRQGFAVDDQENEAGVRCAAVPIYGSGGALAGSMSLSTLVSVVDEREFAAYIERLMQVGVDVSRRLGYKG